MVIKHLLKIYFQRYFIVFVFWAGIGAAIGAYYIFLYLLKFVEPNWYPLGFLKFTAPIAVIRWFMGLESFLNTSMCVLFSIASASSIAAFVFFGSQVCSSSLTIDTHYHQPYFCCSICEC